MLQYKQSQTNLKNTQMKKFINIVLSIFVLTPFFTTPLFASVGVGVGLGKIQVDEILKQGMKYTLPPLTILNTGDVPGEYTIGVAYHQDQPELLPPEEWFTFTPLVFHLEPGDAQTVKMEITLPIKDIVPGDYFAYIEGMPIQNLDTGESVIGIAAATKLYFTVAPSNIFEGIYYRALSIYNQYTPYSTALLAILAAILIWILFRRFFNIDFTIQRNEKSGQ